jgi:hypothetical protein
MRKEIVLAVALALGSTYAVAQEAPCLKDGKPVELSKADTDKDGKISKSECDAATKAPGAAGPKGEGGATSAPAPATAPEKEKK